MPRPAYRLYSNGEIVDTATLTTVAYVTSPTELEELFHMRGFSQIARIKEIVREYQEGK